MTRRRTTIAIVALALAVAGVAWALTSIKLLGRGTASDPITVTWAATPAATSSDSAGLNDPLQFGMSPTRATTDVSKTTATVSGISLLADTTNWRSGTLYTIQANSVATTQSLMLQRAVMVQAAGSDPIPAGAIVVYNDPTQCGSNLNTGGPWRIGVKYVGDAPSAATVYSFDLQLEFVDVGSHSSGACTNWPAL